MLTLIKIKMYLQSLTGTAKKNSSHLLFGNNLHAILRVSGQACSNLATKSLLLTFTSF